MDKTIAVGAPIAPGSCGARLRALVGALATQEQLRELGPEGHVISLAEIELAQELADAPPGPSFDDAAGGVEGTLVTPAVLGELCKRAAVATGLAILPPTEQSPSWGTGAEGEKTAAVASEPTPAVPGVTPAMPGVTPPGEA